MIGSTANELQVNEDGELRDLTAQSDGTCALYAIELYDLTNSGNVVGIDEPACFLVNWFTDADWSRYRAAVGRGVAVPDPAALAQPR